MSLRIFTGAALCVGLAIAGCAASAPDGELATHSQLRPGNTDRTYGLRQMAITDALRPADEVARDSLRKPDEMLAFIGLESGDVIADIRPEEGYFTRLFARVVGPSGHVYAVVPTRTAEREDAYADTLSAAYPNVSRVTTRLETMTFDRPLDVVFTAQEYHDFTMPRFEVDVAAMNRAAFAALKPGGLYIIIDHSGRPGTGATEASTLHRIEGAEVRRQVEAAGFVFDGETNALANPDDDRTINVFDEAIRGRTDQFVYRFRKPG